jgi:hypothetical protein
MARQLKITRKKKKKEPKSHVWSAKDLETDPCDESTGISSNWQEMIENMEVEIIHTSQGTKALWKPKRRR